MKNFLLTLFTILVCELKSFCQPCGVAQLLSSTQQSQISFITPALDTALKYEDLFHIDSLNTELKNIYSTQGGRPDAVENYVTLTSNVNWLNLTNSILLSRALIAADSMVYVDLWKTAKGMNPPSYQPHSLFLRSSAEIAAGLLKIADKETDLTRKALYQSWATRALDSLATMQLPNGAFPFPDLRTYGDPVFTPIIQNFLNWCGADSVNVLQGGWIVDDKGTGEFKFDAGVIANAYYEAYQYTGNVNYKNIAIAVGDYLKPLHFNDNYNYNTFVSLGLTRAYELTNDTTYRDRAIVNLRHSVFPGQIANGRWVDGHNANSRYHSIIIQNIVPTFPFIPTSNSYKTDLESMVYAAVKNMVDYTYTCNSATGYRWVMKSFFLDPSIIPITLKDSIIDLIGQHINQSAIDGRYLDVPTMGEYLELLGLLPGFSENVLSPEIKINVFPNPSNGIFSLVLDNSETETIVLSVYDVFGNLIETNNPGTLSRGTYNYPIDLSQQPAGVYFISVTTSNQTYSKKIIRTE